ncbi:hypothetical protein BJ944DRAFT_234486 [Cunninghamella echinulata]|nr:hypothetical protein BJ944DRAFT_234486 [Cunninghamella echinulata]
MAVLEKLNNKETYRIIAGSLNISLGLISKIAKRNYINCKNNAGRHSEISCNLGRLIARNFYTGKFSTAIGASRALRFSGYNISAYSIRFLDNNDFVSEIKKSALPLTTIRKKKRLN